MCIVLEHCKVTDCVKRFFFGVSLHSAPCCSQQTAYFWRAEGNGETDGVSVKQKAQISVPVWLWSVSSSGGGEERSWDISISSCMFSWQWVTRLDEAKRSRWKTQRDWHSRVSVFISGSKDTQRSTSVLLEIQTRMKCELPESDHVSSEATISNERSLMGSIPHQPPRQETPSIIIQLLLQVEPSANIWELFILLSRQL